MDDQASEEFHKNIPPSVCRTAWLDNSLLTYSMDMDVKVNSKEKGNLIIRKENASILSAL